MCPLVNDRTQRASDRSARAEGQCPRSIPSFLARFAWCDWRPAFPRPRSSNPLHSENAIWKAPKSALKNVTLVRRASSRVSLVRVAGIAESHRSGGPGVIGEFHIRREPANLVFQNSSALFQHLRFPKSAFGRAPRRIGLRHRRQSLGRSHNYLRCKRQKDPERRLPDSSRRQWRDESRRPSTWSFGRATQIDHAIERPLHEVEWRAENFRCQFFDRFRSRIVGATSRKSKLIPQLLRIICSGRSLAGKDRETQNFLTIDDSLDRSATLSFGQESVHVDETADVIRVVLRPGPARLPKVPVVGKSADEAALHRYRAIV